jgi:hypothetical protein
VWEGLGELGGAVVLALERRVFDGWMRSRLRTGRRSRFARVAGARLVDDDAMSDLLLFSLIAMTLAALPFWSYSRSWGFAPSGALTAVVMVVIVSTLWGAT